MCCSPLKSYRNCKEGKSTMHLKDTTSSANEFNENTKMTVATRDICSIKTERSSSKNPSLLSSSSSSRVSQLFTCNDLKFQIKLSKTKFSCICLLVLLGVSFVRTSHAIPVPTSASRLILHTPEYKIQRYQQLLQEERSSVYPTPRRHHLHLRSIESMEDVENSINQEARRNSNGNGNGNDDGHELDYCRRIKPQSLQLAIRHAKASLTNMYNDLHRYTQARHGETPDSVYTQWKIHSLQLEHPYKNFLDRDFGEIRKELPRNDLHLTKQPLTKELIETEIQNINKTLKILQKAYESEIFKQNEERQRHEFGTERLNVIKEFIKKTKNYTANDLNHIEDIMSELSISYKDDGDNAPSLQYNEQAQQLEWLFLLEHMSFLRYCIAIYKFLLEKCHGQ